jgi:hypothetical protein
LRCRNAFEAVATEVARVAYHMFALANPTDVFASRCLLDMGRRRARNLGPAESKERPVSRDP